MTDVFDINDYHRQDGTAALRQKLDALPANGAAHSEPIICLCPD